MTLLQWLETRLPTAKRQTLKRMLEAGRVRVNGRPASRLKLELAETDKVDVNDAPIAKPRSAASADLTIIHEDADLLVVHKPEGLLTSTVPREPRPTLLAMVRAHVAETHPGARVGLIHRLDRDASGLLVFSKNEAAYESLKRQFFNHSVDRVYAAIVEGKPHEPKGTIRTKLREHHDGKVFTDADSPHSQIAVTMYTLLKTVKTPAGERSLLRVSLQTGRKHQIRAHLSERGTPIVNDKMYGSQPPNGPLMLAAMLLSLRHPVTDERVTWEVEIPLVMREAIREAAPGESPKNETDPNGKNPMRK